MSIRLGIVGDLHWSHAPINASWHNAYDVAGVLDRLAAAISLFRDCECDALVCLGDLTHNGDEESLDTLLQLLRDAWSGPLLVVPGNHDQTDLPEVVEATLPGRRPPIARMLLAPDGRAEGRLDGTDAAAEHIGARIVASHYPLVSRRALLEERGFAYADDLANREGIEDELAAPGDPVVVLCGHLHVRDAAASGPLLQLAFGALVEAPFECAVVDASEDSAGAASIARLSRSLRPTDPHDPVPVFSPDDDRWRYEHGRWTPVARQRPIPVRKERSLV